MAKKYEFNVFTGEIDIIDVSSGSVGSYNVDKVTLNATDISNKQIVLNGTPTTDTDTRLIVIGGIEQEYSVDFSVSGATLSWNGLGLDGVLADGDRIIIVYN